jgi:hypothetical protein
MHSSKQGAAKINRHCGAQRYMNLDRISYCIDTPIVINLLLSGVLNMRRPSVFITDLCGRQSVYFMMPSSVILGVSSTIFLEYSGYNCISPFIWNTVFGVCIFYNF